MKKSFRYIVMSLVILMGCYAPKAFAGNEDRSGQAGAAELLINPWAASAGWGNAGMSFVSGVDAIWGNVAGITSARSFELNFTHTDWLHGSGIKLSSAGLLARVGESGVLGLSFVSFNLGKVPLTTVDAPDPGTRTYEPTLMNINLCYAKTFSNSISGGFNLKIISESIADMSATGVAIDAGIQYVTGATENVHFGITLKNIGTPMRFGGDGISFKSFFMYGDKAQFTIDQRTQQFELPTQLNIAAAYDFHMASMTRLTLAGNFCSNAFSRDQYTLGAEFAWREMLVLRAGYTYEKGIFSGVLDDKCINLNRGLSAGLSVQVPLSKDENAAKFAVDYAFRDTYSFKGTHSIGARLIF